MRKLSVIVSLLVLFGFCFANPIYSEQGPILTSASSSVSGVRSPSWTIMVYLDGDNDLEAFGINDFLEIAAIGSDSNVNVVVQFDRIDGYDYSYGDWTSTKRFYVTNGMTPTAANALMDLGEVNMGNPAELADFVNWGKTNYPASNYALILWNHGDGWRESKEELWRMWRERKQAKKKELIFKAVCLDFTNDDGLYMAEVKSALSASGSTDLIGFDACLMGMVEVAYEIKDYGQVMVGSEEVESGDGWPYDMIMNDLTTNPSWTPSQLGSAIVDRYYESYGNNKTQSAIDLTRMNTLANTISTLAQTMINYWNTDKTAVRNAAQDVMAEITNTVINEKHGSGWPGANGLAIYFPENVYEFDEDYNGSNIDFPDDTQWEEFLQEFYSLMGTSWIYDARASSQEFSEDPHVDLYHFCKLLAELPGDYYSESQITHEYIGGGTAQNFQADDDYFTYSLPFDFPYFGETILSGTDIYISSNGYVDFTSGSNHFDCTNTISELAANKRIAPCWADLRTDGIAQPGEDVYITENIDNLVIRWAAETYVPPLLGDPEPVNVELVLYQDGRIQFNYNGNNAGIAPLDTPPTIGISKGDTLNYYLSVYDGQSILTNVDSDLFTPTPSSSITIISPNGGECWQLGSFKTITWDAQEVSGNLQITLWENGVKKGRIASVAPTSTSYTWEVGKLANGAAVSPGEGYKIKIKEKGKPVCDESDSPFTICSLEVTSPNGSENWKLRSLKDITWDAQEVSGNLQITLWKEGVKVGRIATVAPSSTSYTWKVGELASGGPVLPGTGYKIKIKEKGKPVCDFSDAPFTITGIKVDSPNGDESWQLGSFKNITWAAQGVSQKLQITLWKGEVKKGRIASAAPTSTSYTWEVGKLANGAAVSPGTGYKIKIKEKGKPVADFSDSSFTLTN